MRQSCAALSKALHCQKLCIVKNGETLFKAFIKHYSALGLNHLFFLDNFFSDNFFSDNFFSDNFFLDNGSTDNTLKVADVESFYTFLSTN